jgi:hypothetical protein
VIDRPFSIGGILDFPLQLAQPGFDPRTGKGYNIRDTNLVLQQFASANKAGFLDTLELLRKNTHADTINAYFDAIESPTLVTGEVPVYPGMAGGMQVLDVLMNRIQESQQGGLGPRRVIMPLNVAFASSEGAKDDHAMVLLIEEHPDARGKYRIALLEQHARRDGSKLDYSKEKKQLLEYMRGFYPDAIFHENTQPFCTEERVCGIASLAVCKKLMGDKNSYDLAADNRLLQLSAGDIAAEHAQNVKLAQAAAVSTEGRDAGESRGGNAKG